MPIYLKLDEAGTGVEQFASNQGYETIIEGRTLQSLASMCT